MSKSVLLWTSVIAIVWCAGWALSADPPPDKPSPDECVLEVDLPAGSTIKIAGQEYRGQTSFRWTKLGDRFVNTTLEVTYPDGQTLSKSIELLGGQRIHIRKPVDLRNAPELVVQSQHLGEVGCVAFSPDGSYYLTGGNDYKVRLWDAKNDRLLRAIRHENSISSCNFLNDGKTVLSTPYTTDSLWWNARTGAIDRRLDLDANYPRISRGGRFLAMLGDKHWRTLDTATGQTIRRVESDEFLYDIAVSSDGKIVVTGSGTFANQEPIESIGIWSVAEGTLNRRIGTKEPVDTIRLDNNGKSVFTTHAQYGIGTGEITRWELASGKRLATYRGHVKGISAMVLDGASKFLASGGYDDELILWDIETASPLYREKLPSRPTALAFHPDNHVLLCGTAAGSLYRVPLKEAIAGKGRSSLVKGTRVNDVQATYRMLEVRTGTFATRDEFHTTLWDAQRGFPVKRIATPRGFPVQRDIFVNSLGRAFAVFESRFSFDEQEVPTEKTVCFVDIDSGEVTKLAVPMEIVLCGVDFVNEFVYMHKPTVLVDPGVEGAINSYIRFDLKTRAETELAEMPENDRTFATLQRSMLTEGPRRRASNKIAIDSKNDSTVVDSETRREIRKLTNTQISICFSNSCGIANDCVTTSNHRYAYTTCPDYCVKLWDICTGDELAKIFHIGETDWLAVTPEGLFDGTAAGREMVAFRVGGGLDVHPVDRFYNTFARPGLLDELLSGQRPLPDIDANKLAKQSPPLMAIVSPTQPVVTVADNEIEVTLDVTEQGGGLKGPFVRLNGQRMNLQPEKVSSSGKTTRYKFRVPLADAENRIRFEASDSNESWESEPVKLSAINEGKVARPDLYVLCVGINEYQDPKMNLTLARNDATAMAKLFRDRASKLFANVHIETLVDTQATKTAIQEQLTKKLAAKVRPQDVFILHISGHGSTLGDRYYFLPHEFQNSRPTVEESVREHGIPGDVLGDWLGSVKSTKRIMIFDTCNSGGVLKQVAGRRNAFGFDSAIQRLSRAQGCFVLAAAPATVDAREVSKLGHGILTYALLAAAGEVSQGPLEDAGLKNQTVSVDQWFSYANDKVPSLYRLYLNQVQDIEAQTQGTPFPIFTPK